MLSKNIITLFIIVSCFSVNCKKNALDSYEPNSVCSCVTEPTALDKYSYPFKPPSAKWDSSFRVGGADLAFQVCLQVPLDTIKSMTTLGLIQSILANPSITSTMLLYDNKFQGRDAFLKKIYLSWELNKRVDAGSVIIDYYSKRTPCCINNISLNDTLKRGNYSLDRYCFDMLCTQDSIINKLNVEQKKFFGKILIDQFYILLKYSDFGISKTSASLVISSIMLSASYQPYINALNTSSSLKILASTGILTDDPEKLYNMVMTYAKQFVIS